jgi:uncharacterized protein (DUF2141 family)
MNLILSILFAINFLVPMERVTITLEGFENDKGKAYVRVRNANDETVEQKILTIKNKKASFTIDTKGQNSIAVDAYHDENNNGKMDYNLFGAPTEAWGVSSKNRPTFRAPTLEEILVPVKNGSVVTVKMK